MPTEIWSRIKLGVCGPPLCWGQTAILKHFERSLLAWVEGLVGGIRHFWENVSRSQKAIWLDLRVNSGGTSAHFLAFYSQNGELLQSLFKEEQLSPKAKTHRTQSCKKKCFVCHFDTDKSAPYSFSDISTSIPYKTTVENTSTTPACTLTSEKGGAFHSWKNANNVKQWCNFSSDSSVVSDRISEVSKVDVTAQFGKSPQTLGKCKGVLTTFYRPST